MLFEPHQLRRRLDVLDRAEHLLAWAPEDARGTLQALCDRIEAANDVLYRSIREDLRRGGSLERWVEWVLGQAPMDVATADGYDHLDTLVSGVLSLDEPEPNAVALDADMVFYQPTPARHVLDVLGRLALGRHDVFIDLGSGLGHVALLAAICTDARCIGIELEPAYVVSAKHCAEALNVANVAFLQQDVRSADLSEGTVFFLYTPFTGALLREVMASLEQVAANRRIRICTLGPCTQEFAQASWLERIDASGAVAVFRSV